MQNETHTHRQGSLTPDDYDRISEYRIGTRYQDTVPMSPRQARGARHSKARKSSNSSFRKPTEQAALRNIRYTTSTEGF